ncbi:MAG: cobalamin-dependent protein [Desulfuromonadales bacterium]|nr:cobalamin-dependent protein [Desulfuromonadales bacterium]
MPPACSQQTLVDRVYPDYLSALLAGRRQQCLALVSELMDADVPLKTIYLDLFERSMYQVGELWESNRISVATEHIATAITENAMGLLHPVIFASEHCGRKAIISCVANEYHQIGGKMVADIFELHGWDGYFLGANTPIHDLLSMIAEKKPDLVSLSLTMFSNIPELLRHLATLRENCPGLPVIVGGQAFRWGGAFQVEGLPKVRLLRSIDELESLIANFPMGLQ